jgi:uncharacterized protein (TIGR00251 family)
VRIDTLVGGISFAVRVIPRAGRSAIGGTRDGALIVRVNAAPVDGAANDELIEMLASALRVPRRSVVIVSGERGRLKRIQVSGIDAAAAARVFAVR